MSQGSTAGVNARPTIQGKREVEPRTADRRPLGRGRSLHRPAVGPDVRLLILCCRPHAGALWGGRFRPPQTRLPPQTSPAGVNARREGSRPPGRVLARQGAAPLSRLTPTLPVCGARIMRRMLKRACILRPPHLLRLAVSAAGGARLRSPLPKPPLQGEVDAPQGADGGVHCRFAAEISCKARQDLAPCPQGTMLVSSPGPCAVARSRGGPERPPYKTGQTGIRTGNDRHRPGQTQGKPLPKCPRRSPCSAPPRTFTVS